jgi:hypothetical protein
MTLMYLWFWVRRAGLVGLGVLAVLVLGLVLASFGSQRAAAQDQMASWMYMPSADIGSGSLSFPLVSTHAASGVSPGSIPTGSGAADPPATSSGSASVIASLHLGDLEQYLRPAHSAEIVPLVTSR